MEYPSAATQPFEDLEDRSGATALQDDGSVRLVGSRCESCGARAFPRRDVCVACCSIELVEDLLGPNGTLYSWSMVHVAPDRATPYCIGYVDLDEGVRVLTTVIGAHEGQDLDLSGHLVSDPDGDWAFLVDHSDARGV